MKIKNLLFIVAFVILSGCNSDDKQNNIVTSTDLIGTWNLKSQTIEDGTFTGPIQGIQLTANYSAVAKNINFTYTFSENPNKIKFNGSYTIVATVSLLGQNQVQNQEINTNNFPIDSANWSLSNNTISGDQNSELPISMNIEEFSSNYMKLKGDFNQTLIENGETITITGTLYVELEK